MDARVINITDKDVILNDPNLLGWQKNLVHGTIMNLEEPGGNIRINPNGASYLFYDGQSGWFPKAAVSIANSTGRWVPVKKANMVSIDDGQKIKKEFRYRYRFIATTDDQNTEDLEALRVAAVSAAKVAEDAVNKAETSDAKAKEEEAKRIAAEKELEDLRAEFEAMRAGQALEDGVVPVITDDGDK